jgi:hypothetical protein
MTQSLNSVYSLLTMVYHHEIFIKMSHLKTVHYHITDIMILIGLWQCLIFYVIIICTFDYLK